MSVWTLCLPRRSNPKRQRCFRKGMFKASPEFSGAPVRDFRSIHRTHVTFKLREIIIVENHAGDIIDDQVLWNGSLYLAANVKCRIAFVRTPPIVESRRWRRRPDRDPERLPSVFASITHQDRQPAI